MDIFTLKDVSFSRNNQLIFESLNLTFPKGQFIGLLGSNGTGKTTLLKMMAKLNRPTKGTIYYGEQNREFAGYCRKTCVQYRSRKRWTNIYRSCD